MEKQTNPTALFNKTRLAPTPSGYLHLGNILSFAITAALAKTSDAKILLRIDDLDRARANNLYVQDIFDMLNFLEIPWDEGPWDMQQYEAQWSQIHRLDMYQKALQQLQQTGKVFACTCSRAQIEAISPDGTYPGTCRNKHLPLDTENACWRLDTSAGKMLAVKTLVENVLTALPADMQYFIVKKKDGYPAYQLSSLIDDLYFNIDLIVRGQDLWPSTLAQHYLASALGKATFSDITFYHHPLLTEGDGNKLSKSAGATSVNYMRTAGKKPADVYSAIAAMLGINAQINSWEELTALIVSN